MPAPTITVSKRCAAKVPAAFSPSVRGISSHSGSPVRRSRFSVMLGLAHAGNGNAVATGKAPHASPAQPCVAFSPRRARVPADRTSRRLAGRRFRMKSHARVVVIGGGVVGVSTLYHLARKGWSDVALVERQGAHLGLDLACRRPAAALQHELLGRADPQILRRLLQDPGGGNRPECRVLRVLQYPPRPHQGPMGRVLVLCRRRAHDRRERRPA